MLNPDVVERSLEANRVLDELREVITDDVLLQNLDTINRTFASSPTKLEHAGSREVLLLIGLLPYIVHSLREKVGSKDLVDRLTKLEAMTAGAVMQVAAHHEQLTKRMILLEARIRRPIL
jgi:hypothetical protein